MEIKWNINPLCTQIILNEHDKEILKLNMLIEELREHMSSALFYLEDKQYANKETALRELNWIYDKDGEYREISEEEIESVIEDLLSSHVGDCTCDACSCMKCRAEDLIGICTIEGIGKHSLRYINSAMITCENNIDKAIEYLENYKANPRPDTWPTSMEYDKYVPGWEQSAHFAGKWLQKYKEDHNF